MNIQLVFLLLLAPLVQQDENQKVKEALNAFNKAFMSPQSKEKDREAAIKEVALIKHPKTMMAVSLGLKDKVNRVRIAAAKELGDFTEIKGAGRVLLSSLRDPSNKKRERVRIEIIGALGNLKERAALHDLHKTLNGREFEVAKAAAIACGKIREKSSIPLLIQELLKAERDPESMGDPATPGETATGKAVGTPEWAIDEEQQKEQARRKAILEGPLQETLKAMTKERWNSGQDWHRWWKKHGSKFRFEAK